MKKDTKNRSLKNKLKLFAVTALAFTAISAAAIGVVGIEKAHAEEWKGGEIKQNYVFGETLKVPDYVLSVNGKELKTTSVVEFPDGTNYGSDEVRLSQAGKYGVKLPPHPAPSEEEAGPGCHALRERRSTHR